MDKMTYNSQAFYWVVMQTQKLESKRKVALRIAYKEINGTAWGVPESYDGDVLLVS